MDPACWCPQTPKNLSVGGSLLDAPWRLVLVDGTQRAIDFLFLSSELDFGLPNTHAASYLTAY